MLCNNDLQNAALTHIFCVCMWGMLIYSVEIVVINSDSKLVSSKTAFLSMTDRRSTRWSTVFHITAPLSFKTGCTTAACLEKFLFFLCYRLQGADESVWTGLDASHAFSAHHCVSCTNDSHLHMLLSDF